MTLKSDIDPYLKSRISVVAGASAADQIGNHIFETEMSAAVPFEKITRYYLLSGDISVEDAAFLLTYHELKKACDHDTRLSAISSWSAKISAAIIPIMLGLPKSLGVPIALLGVLGDYGLQCSKKLRTDAQFPRFSFFREDFYRYRNQYAP